MADTLLYTADKTLKDAGDKVGPQDKKDVEEKLDALRKVKDGETIEEIQKATQELSQAIQKIGASLHSEKSSEQGSDEKKDEEQKPEEGEFKEEK